MRASIVLINRFPQKRIGYRESGLYPFRIERRVFRYRRGLQIGLCAFGVRTPTAKRIGTRRCLNRWARSNTCRRTPVCDCLLFRNAFHGCALNRRVAFVFHFHLADAGHNRDVSSVHLERIRVGARSTLRGYERRTHRPIRVNRNRLNLFQAVAVRHRNRQINAFVVYRFLIVIRVAFVSNRITRLTIDGYGSTLDRRNHLFLAAILCVIYDSLFDGHSGNRVFNRSPLGVQRQVFINGCAEIVDCFVSTARICVPTFERVTSGLGLCRNRHRCAGCDVLRLGLVVCFAVHVEIHRVQRARFHVIRIVFAHALLLARLGIRRLLNVGPIAPVVACFDDNAFKRDLVCTFGI